ncbi:hypothetical protein [Halopenitus persicus]|uniref:hypothetical protein n=1 Tax=Halopenitus persicus TaxID=1048396 RepID=UPI0015A111C0|nr:hypothetical protein [Halopenitus persicus]
MRSNSRRRSSRIGFRTTRVPDDSGSGRLGSRSNEGRMQRREATLREFVAFVELVDR